MATATAIRAPLPQPFDKGEARYIRDVLTAAELTRKRKALELKEEAICKDAKGFLPEIAFQLDPRDADGHVKLGLSPEKAEQLRRAVPIFERLGLASLNDEIRRIESRENKLWRGNPPLENTEYQSWRAKLARLLLILEELGAVGEPDDNYEVLMTNIGREIIADLRAELVGD